MTSSTVPALTSANQGAYPAGKGAVTIPVPAWADRYLPATPAGKGAVTIPVPAWAGAWHGQGK